MTPLNRDQAIWLTRGVALGIILRRLLRALRANEAMCPRSPSVSVEDQVWGNGSRAQSREGNGWPGIRS
jgi:hypothetical protein